MKQVRVDSFPSMPWLSVQVGATARASLEYSAPRHGWPLSSVQCGHLGSFPFGSHQATVLVNQGKSVGCSSNPWQHEWAWTQH